MKTENTIELENREETQNVSPSDAWKVRLFLGVQAALNHLTPGEIWDTVDLAIGKKVLRK